MVRQLLPGELARTLQAGLLPHSSTGPVFILGCPYIYRLGGPEEYSP